METNSGSWRLFTALEGHTTSHYITLHHTSYADNLKFIKNKSHKDSLKTSNKLEHSLDHLEIKQGLE